MKLQDQDNLEMLRKMNNTTIAEVQHVEHSQLTSQPQVLEKSHDDQGEKNQDHGHGHDNHENCSHKKGGKKIPGQKNYFIIIYTVFTCLSCFYLQTQHLNPLINDSKSQLMTYLTFIDVVLCLWSYFQTIRINSHVVKIQEKDPKPYALNYAKRCQKCDYWKGPRVSHCSTCGKCIYKLDHHCIWTQTCIGYCNQKSFYLFCLYMAIGVLQFWYSTMRALAILTNNCNFFGTFQPGVYILWGITCISAGFVGAMIVGLSIAHSFFIITNFTTLQSMKTRRNCPIPFIQTRRIYFQANTMNLWDRGQIQNIKQVFGNNMLTCWMPLARQIENQFIFQPMNPIVQVPLQKKVFIKDEANEEIRGKKIKINDQVIQV